MFIGKGAEMTKAELASLTEQALILANLERLLAVIDGRTSVR
jgi:hypothetical protein